MNLGNRHSQHSFAQIPRVNMARSRFDRSFTVKDTFNFDELTPIFVDEVLPGDTINLNVKNFTRLATQAVPVLDNMYIDYYFFFTPCRLVWENWERFNGAQDDPGDPVDFLVPQIAAPEGGFLVGSIYDKMGIPTEVEGLSINALPFRACNLIYNDWFRDQNLQNSLSVPKTDGPDLDTLYEIQTAAKKHDYFTSALPWPQKGDAISLPMAGSAPVYGEIMSSETSGHRWQTWVNSDSLRRTGDLNLDGETSSLDARLYPGASSLNPGNAKIGNSFALAAPDDYAGNQRPPYADLTEATAATINQFRQAIMIQSLLELDARGGTRYVEILRAHFNVISPDFRLQRPEYLSGGSIRINQHPIAQTSESGTTPQANLAAFSTASNMGNNIGFSKSFVEHGYVIGFARARADVTYQQGLNRMWSRRTRYDFFWPKLQELGEQAIYNREIYAQGNETDEEIFGYQERFADYRYKPSEIRGQLRSTYAQSLDVWHLAEEFESLPALNDTFIKGSTPIDRVLVVTEGYPALLADYWFDYKHARPMMTYGVPATLGRF